MAFVSNTQLSNHPSPPSVASQVTSIRTNQASPGNYDWALLTIAITLFGLGLVMVFSASYAWGVEGYEDPYHYIIKQVAWGMIGLVALVLMARIPYKLWERWSVILMALSLFALMSVIVFGTETFGATRTYFGGSVQPSEPAKIIIVIYVSAWLASKGTRIRDVRVGLVPFSVLMGAVSVLIVAQPEISTAILIVVTASVMFFIAGAELKQLLVVGAGTGATFWLVIHYSSYAKGRVERYMESLWDPLQSAEYQVQRSVEALVRGGIVGSGVGQGKAQLPGYLPVSWSDNIFAVIGEEMGLLGGLLIILLFALLAYRGLRIALRSNDNFGMLLATGITASLSLQALLNMAVSVAAAPPTGVTLPFVSYGGSSLVTALAAVGILLNISRYGSNRISEARMALGVSAPARSKTAGEKQVEQKKKYANFDFGWRNRRPRVPRASNHRPTTTRASRTPKETTGGRDASSRRTSRSAK